MNCFVIMPFAVEYDDVYLSIQTCVESATGSVQGKCFRIDENQPAGRISDRLLSELRIADICIADLTGLSPNVMWETGFAMAVGCPVILITQDAKDLPFDLHDFFFIRYERTRLAATLAEPLRKSVIDTLQSWSSNNQTSSSNLVGTEENSKLIGELLSQVQDLKVIVAEAVKAWSRTANASENTTRAIEGLRTLEGYWIDLRSDSHFYARVVGTELYVPYNYGGHVGPTAVFYDWHKIKDYWFSRFRWSGQTISGFAFLRNESVDTYTGSWWYDNDPEVGDSISPNSPNGNPIHLVRERNCKFPAWAERYFQLIAERGFSDDPNSYPRTETPGPSLSS